MLKGLFQGFDLIKKISSDLEEDWGYITFKGLCPESSMTNNFVSLSNEINALKLNQSITYRIDNSTFKTHDDFLENIYQGCNWQITLNKSNYLDLLGLNFFYDLSKFLHWSNRISAFDPDSIFNKSEKVKIGVNGIGAPFGGPNILVYNGSDDSSFDLTNYNLPAQSKIKTVIHYTLKEEIPLNPINHLITFGKNNEFSSSFFERSAICLSICLSSEINSKNSLILRGVRRLDLSLVDSASKDKIKPEFIKNLINTISWVYEERTELRIKLLLDRVTLDIDYTKPYIDGLSTVINSSLQQAKERYAFILYDRKDEYQKELRELLKDLKNLNELYSSKLRGVLNNLLRDILATLVLIGFTLLTKVSEIKLLSNNHLLTPLFKIFSGYFLFSIIFQAVTDWYDIQKTRNEFIYWKKISREYISQSDFENHLKSTVNKRRNGTILIYIILAIVYSLISFSCWNFNMIVKYIFAI